MAFHTIYSSASGNPHLPSFRQTVRASSTPNPKVVRRTCAAHIDDANPGPVLKFYHDFSVNLVKIACSNRNWVPDIGLPGSCHRSHPRFAGWTPAARDAPR
jgi:hypothetical protein